MAKKFHQKVCEKGQGQSQGRRPAGLQRRKPIALYYWPTPNGHKVSIMLEELGVPYDVHPNQHRQGRASSPRPSSKSPPTTACPAIWSTPMGGRAGRSRSFRIRRHPPIIWAANYGRFYPQGERERVQVEEWLFWAGGWPGPDGGAGQPFPDYAPEDLPYAKKRYTDEVHRLFGVMNKRLATKKFLAGAYSIADMACWSWVLRDRNMCPWTNSQPQGLARPGGGKGRGCARQGGGG